MSKNVIKTSFVTSFTRFYGFLSTIERISFENSTILKWRVVWLICEVMNFCVKTNEEIDHPQRDLNSRPPVELKMPWFKCLLIELHARYFWHLMPILTKDNMIFEVWTNRWPNLDRFWTHWSPILKFLTFRWWSLRLGWLLR